MTGWQWHQPDHMQIICTSLQTDNHASTSSLKFLQVGCPSCHPTNSVKALKAVIAMRAKYGTNCFAGIIQVCCSGVESASSFWWRLRLRVCRPTPSWLFSISVTMNILLAHCCGAPFIRRFRFSCHSFWKTQPVCCTFLESESEILLGVGVLIFRARVRVGVPQKIRTPHTWFTDFLIRTERFCLRKVLLPDSN